MRMPKHVDSKKWQTFVASGYFCLIQQTFPHTSLRLGGGLFCAPQGKLPRLPAVSDAAVWAGGTRCVPALNGRLSGSSSSLSSSGGRPAAAAAARSSAGETPGRLGGQAKNSKTTKSCSNLSSSSSPASSVGGSAPRRTDAGAAAFGELQLVHSSAPRTTKLSCLCRVRFGGVNWILDNSRLSPVECLKSEHVNRNCPVHTATADSTRTGLFCRVWCGDVS